jgi:hypothetical protein
MAFSMAGPLARPGSGRASRRGAESHGRRACQCSTDSGSDRAGPTQARPRNRASIAIASARLMAEKTTPSMSSTPHPPTSRHSLPSPPAADILLVPDPPPLRSSPGVSGCLPACLPLCLQVSLPLVCLSVDPRLSPHSPPLPARASPCPPPPRGGWGVDRGRDGGLHVRVEVRHEGRVHARRAHRLPNRRAGWVGQVAPGRGGAPRASAPRRLGQNKRLTASLLGDSALILVSKSCRTHSWAAGPGWFMIRLRPGLGTVPSRVKRLEANEGRKLGRGLPFTQYSWHIWGIVNCCDDPMHQPQGR